MSFTQPFPPFFPFLYPPTNPLFLSVFFYLSPLSPVLNGHPLAIPIFPTTQHHPGWCSTQTTSHQRTQYCARPRHTQYTQIQREQKQIEDQKPFDKRCGLCSFGVRGCGCCWHQVLAYSAQCTRRDASCCEVPRACWRSLKDAGAGIGRCRQGEAPMVVRGLLWEMGTGRWARSMLQKILFNSCSQQCGTSPGPGGRAIQRRHVEMKRVVGGVVAKCLC